MACSNGYFLNNVTFYSIIRAILRFSNDLFEEFEPFSEFKSLFDSVLTTLFPSFESRFKQL